MRYVDNGYGNEGMYICMYVCRWRHRQAPCINAKRYDFK